jgi:hypothetical protein
MSMSMAQGETGVAPTADVAQPLVTLVRSIDARAPIYMPLGASTRWYASTPLAPLPVRASDSIHSVVRCSASNICTALCCTNSGLELCRLHARTRIVSRLS